MKPAAKKKRSDSRRLHLVYFGRVQGVGFRYTAQEIADQLSVTGWVRNLPDGNVEVMTEGGENALKEFDQKVQDSVVGKHIKKIERQWLNYENEFTEFRIEFAY